MNIGNIVTGRLELNLPFVFPGLYLNTPTHADFLKTVPFMSTYKPVAQESLLDLERALPDDFVDIKHEAEKERKKIVLTLDGNETPDERFIKSQEELNAMTPEELQSYHDYIEEQYGAMKEHLENSPVIRKWQAYAYLRQLYYSRTKEAELAKMQQETLFVASSTTSDGTPYFADIVAGLSRLHSLTEDDYQKVMRSFDAVYTGETPSFF